MLTDREAIKYSVTGNYFEAIKRQLQELKVDIILIVVHKKQKLF